MENGVKLRDVVSRRDLMGSPKFLRLTPPPRQQKQTVAPEEHQVDSVRPRRAKQAPVERHAAPPELEDAVRVGSINRSRRWRLKAAARFPPLPAVPLGHAAPPGEDAAAAEMARLVLVKGVGIRPQSPCACLRRGTQRRGRLGHLLPGGEGRDAGVRFMGRATATHGTGSSSKIFQMTVSLAFSSGPASPLSEFISQARLAACR